MGKYTWVIQMIDTTRIKDIREDKDITQKQMASILGVNRSTYSMWEIGLSFMSVEQLCKFANYFNYSIDYVLGLSNNRKNVITGNFDYKKLGKNIKMLRIKNSLSQVELANKMKVTQTCIVRWEKGITKISLSNLYELAKIFKISLDKICYSS